jgi:hypothetical protein
MGMIMHVFSIAERTSVRCEMANVRCLLQEETDDEADISSSESESEGEYDIR